MCAEVALQTPSLILRIGSVLCSPEMAIYHMHATVISRASGGSAVAAAAYRSGEKLIDERTGEAHDYSRRSGVDGAEIIAPEGAPDWVRERDRLWNAGEAAEKRKDSQVAREVRVALPRELDSEQRRELVRGFVQAEFAGRGMVADVSYHDGNSDNPHAHILLTTRELNSDGFGGKDRSWNSKELLSGWREQWAESANRALEGAGRAERIDHRTLAAQREEAIERGQGARAEKLDRDPEIHLGKAAWMARRRGEGNARTRRNDRICAGNRSREMERGRLGRAIRAVDLQIKAQHLREAVSRGSAWASGKVKAGAALVRSIPQRREQARADRSIAAFEAGAKGPWEKDSAGVTALHYAAAAGRDGLVDRLIQAGAWVETYDRACATPLDRAAAAGHATTIERLIEAGAPVKTSDFAGVTPLHRAVEAGAAESTRILIKHGANPHEADGEGRTPATMAQAAGQQDIVKQIQEWDAKRKAEKAAALRQWELDAPKRAAAAARYDQRKAQEAAQQQAREEARRTQLKAIEAAQQKEWMEITRKQAAKRAREDAIGKAEFVRSLDPKSSKEQTWNERELGQKWKKDNFSEAWQIERAAEAARPKQEPGLERDYGPSR